MVVIKNIISIGELLYQNWWVMSESQADFLNGVLLAACTGVFSRYVEGSRAAAEDADGAKLQPVALSCVLNIGACKLKMSDWQGAVDSCLEVSLLMFLRLNIWISVLPLKPFI